MNVPRPADEFALQAIYSLLGREWINPDGDRNFRINRVEIEMRREQDGLPKVVSAGFWCGEIPLRIFNEPVEDFGGWTIAAEGLCVGGVTPPGKEEPDAANLKNAVEEYRRNGFVRCVGILSNGVRTFGSSNHG